MQTRKVFFSFHYEADAWKASIVRNSNVTKSDNDGYIDKAQWESIKKEGDRSIERWIQSQLIGTSVTVVLIGAETAYRRWVKYEIVESCKKGNALLGIYIHNLKDKLWGLQGKKGSNPLDDFQFTLNGNPTKLSAKYQTYDWFTNDGYHNFSRWIEEAAERSCVINDLKDVSLSGMLTPQKVFPRQLKGLQLPTREVRRLSEPPRRELDIFRCLYRQ